MTYRPPRRKAGRHVHPSQWHCIVCGEWFADAHRCPGPEAPLEGDALAAAIQHVRDAIHAAPPPPTVDAEQPPLWD
jgi:hypothetical protein